jgi:hypothetical protein
MNSALRHPADQNNQRANKDPVGRDRTVNYAEAPGSIMVATIPHSNRTGTFFRSALGWKLVFKGRDNVIQSSQELASAGRSLTGSNRANRAYAATPADDRAPTPATMWRRLLSVLEPSVSNSPVFVSATSMGLSAFFVHHHYGEALNLFREPHLLLLG